jgi:hypothetical protein
MVYMMSETGAVPVEEAKVRPVGCAIWLVKHGDLTLRLADLPPRPAGSWRDDRRQSREGWVRIVCAIRRALSLSIRGQVHS